DCTESDPCGAWSSPPVEGGGWACRGPVPGAGGTPVRGLGRGWGRRGTGPRGGGPRRPACLSSALLLGVRGGVEVWEVVGGALRLGGGVHQQGHVVAQHPHPALEIGRAVLEGGVGNAAHATEVGGSTLRHQLFFGVGGIAEATGGRERGAVEPRGVPYRVD